jgi:hypothetical protein
MSVEISKISDWHQEATEVIIENPSFERNLLLMATVMGANASLEDGPYRMGCSDGWTKYKCTHILVSEDAIAFFQL